MNENDSILDEIRLALDANGPRKERFERIGELIREAGAYRWVGIYDVTGDEIAVIAWSGPEAPAHPRFPATRGLCGDAARRGETVVVPDVTGDPRYLTTLGSTRSEIVVPILDPRTGRAIGTLDVESEKTDAFDDEDRLFLERCAKELEKRFVIRDL
jgi:putative methionine-R-sulfoxide reductase with GAF domain